MKKIFIAAIGKEKKLLNKTLDVMSTQIFKDEYKTHKNIAVLDYEHKTHLGLKKSEIKLAILELMKQNVKVKADNYLCKQCAISIHFHKRLNRPDEKKYIIKQKLNEFFSQYRNITFGYNGDFKIMTNKSEYYSDELIISFWIKNPENPNIPETAMWSPRYLDNDNERLMRGLDDRRN